MNKTPQRSATPTPIAAPPAAVHRSRRCPPLSRRRRPSRVTSHCAAFRRRRGRRRRWRRRRDAHRMAALTSGGLTRRCWGVYGGATPTPDWNRWRGGRAVVCCDIVRAVVGWQRRGESAAGVLRCWRSGREGGGRWPVAGVLKGEVTREVTINMLLGEACGKARG